MDYKIVDKVIDKYYFSKADCVSNIHPPTFPDGFDIEVFSYEILKKAFFEAKKNFQREHVTPYIWDNPKKFKINNYGNSSNYNYYKKIRLTLDYKEDYYVIWKIYNKLYPLKKLFELKDIIKFLKHNVHILVNKKYLNVNWYRHHLTELKTIKKKDTTIKFL
jgi:spore coat polysaccharide biosynthesis protein SpsF